QAPGHLAHQFLPTAEDPQRRAAVAHRHAQACAFARADINAEMPRRRAQREGQRLVKAADNLYFVGMRPGDQLARVLKDAEKVRRLKDDTRSFLRLLDGLL